MWVAVMSKSMGDNKKQIRTRTHRKLTFDELKNNVNGSIVPRMRKFRFVG